MAIDQNEKYALKGSQIEDLANRIKAKQDALSAAQLSATNSGITSSGVDKLSGIESGAEVNVQADWTEADVSSDAYIKNKPDLSDYPIITMQSTDPGEGVALEENHFIAVYAAS